MKNKHESTTKKQGRKRNCPEVQRVEWSDGTMKEYAKQLKKSFKQIVKDLELEKEIKDLFKRETKSCIRENSFFIGMTKNPSSTKFVQPQIGLQNKYKARYGQSDKARQ